MLILILLVRRYACYRCLQLERWKEVSVETGQSYTIIEDAWLKKRVGASTELAAKMLQLYTYAEAHSFVYKTPYPNYQKRSRRGLHEAASDSNERGSLCALLRSI